MENLHVKGNKIIIKGNAMDIDYQDIMEEKSDESSRSLRFKFLH